MKRELPALPFGGMPAAGGTVHVVGGGPGDPGLLGLRAAQLLRTADVVAYDRLAPHEVLELCRDGCELVDVGKQPDRHKLSQDEINALLVRRAQDGAAVVRLKGGDPFVLGRGSEEAQACAAAGVPFEVVPAVTSGVAAPAYAGIPVTHRGVAPAFAVVTGHEDPTKAGTQVDYEALARFPGTLLLYMGVGRLRDIARALAAAGRASTTPVAVVGWGTTPRQVTVTGTLDDIGDVVEAAALDNPAMIVVGDVVSLREELRWFDLRPLHGRSVLVPRTRHQASELSARLRALGAEALEAPTIATEPAPDPGALRDAVARCGDGAYDWLALTSPNGVEAVWAAVDGLGLDARVFAAVGVAAVGPGTAAALATHGLRADVLPEPSTTRALVDALVGRAGAGARALLPRADIATPTLADGLRKAGWDVTEVDAYRTVVAPALPAGTTARLREGAVDAIAFASSSTAHNLVRLLGGLPHPKVRVASIGPVTTAACADLGIRVDVEAQRHDVEGLVDAVVRAIGG